MKKGKSTNWEKRAKKEKIVIMVLISAIAVLALVLGYDLYNSFQTKTEAGKEIDFLNSAVIRLSEEKSQLILERDNLDQTVTLLTQEAEQLTTENSALTSELATLQANYDALSSELQGTEADLDACLNP